MTSSEHPTERELSLFSQAEDPQHPRFEAVQRHLAGGCAQCAVAVLRARGRPFDPAEIDSPPPQLAEWLKARRVVRTTATRAGVVADFQLICGAGPYELDILVREFDSPARLRIGGQVVLRDAVASPAVDLGVALLESGDRTLVAVTRTDAFGEFLLESAFGGHYGLRIGDHDDAPVVQVWDGSKP